MRLYCEKGYIRRVFNESLSTAVMVDKQRYLEGHQLYDLKSDPAELDNLLANGVLSQETAEIVDQMHEFISSELENGMEFPVTGPGHNSGKNGLQCFHQSFNVDF